MKKLLLILLCLPFIGFGQNVNIPDANFKAYLVGVPLINTNGDSEIQVSEATAFNGAINCINLNIYDLLGIEAFTALTWLQCSYNELTSLDFSQNIALEVLYCYNNQLISLDVSQNTALTNLVCNSNQILSLDLSANTALTSLNCRDNQLTSLDVSNNTTLTNLNCDTNQIECLDISNNLVLTNLDCNNNLLEQLNTQNGNWQNLYVNATNNNLTCVEVDNIGTATNNWAFDSFATLTTNCNYANSCNMTYGCTDALACNYNASANIDDGSCQLAGCIDLSACNYDVNAFCDDGSCIYLNISVSVSDVSCNGFTDGSVVATANGGVPPFQYSIGGVSQTNGTFSNLTTGFYFIDVTDINGCSSNQAVNINEPSPLFVNAFSTDISCFGYCDGSAFSMPSGGTSPYSYLWSGGNTFVTDNISGLCAGAYVVNITDANNCVNIETVLISEPLPLVSNNTINGCDSVLIGSNYYTISGAYTDTLTSVNGCDSIINTNLTIEQNTSSYDTLSVAASIVWNGIPLNVSGDYSVTLINSLGCDSIVNLNLTVTTTGIADIANSKSNLVKITDMLGKETPYRRNTPLFYIYDDGTVEKRIVIE